MLRRTLFRLDGGSKQPQQLCPEAFLRQLTARGFTAYFGVPDSLLKELCTCITYYGAASAAAPTSADAPPIEQHIIAANEGNAIGLAAGYHLARQTSAGGAGSKAKPVFPVVYMQNSGLGNCVNPLTSLTHREVYSLPMLMLIGWRGKPGSKQDEPQHVAMGRLTTSVLDACEVPHALLPRDPAAAERTIQTAMEHLAEKKTPYAILVDRDTFAAPPASVAASAKAADRALPSYAMSREGAIERILSALPATVPVVGNTGMISREVFETRKRLGQSNSSDFLTVGAMGHASSIASGIVLAQKCTAAEKSDANKNKNDIVVCLDGDGAFIMHMGSAAIAGGERPNKLGSSLVHVVLNNGAHDSVGGQPTVGFNVGLSCVARACGYRTLAEKPVETPEELDAALKYIVGTLLAGGDKKHFDDSRPIFLEVRVKKGNRKDLGRPTSSAADNASNFKKFLSAL